MRFRWAWLATAAVILAGGCGGTQDPLDAEGKAGAVANPREPIQAMLRERGKRLLAGDVEGYLAGLAPEARAFEEPIARQATSLPLSQIDLTIGEATISLDGTRFEDAKVTFNYRYEELPEDNPFQLHLLYQLEQQDGSWVVTGSAFDTETMGILPPPMWAIGPVEFTRSPHFLVMSRPGTPGVAEAVARAEQGSEQLLPKLTLEIDSRYLMVVAPNQEEYDALLPPPSEGGSLAAVLVEYHETAGHPLRPELRHVIVNAPLLFRTTAVELEDGGGLLDPTTVLQHELGHLALSRFTRPCHASWVVEGAAMWLAGERRTDEWRRMVATADLDRVAAKDTEEDDREQREGMGRDEHDPPSISEIYLYPYANAAVSYLIETHGAEKFFDFYQNLKELMPPPMCNGRRPSEQVRAIGTDRILRRYYGFDLRDLDRFTREYVRKAVAE
ncbi:MAG: hypothetical protein M3P34_05060 [Actinomycetota bacterium]|nr:hypothetical protein [Actinomycetota bacterium]